LFQDQETPRLKEKLIILTEIAWICLPPLAPSIDKVLPLPSSILCNLALNNFGSLGIGKGSSSSGGSGSVQPCINQGSGSSAENLGPVVQPGTVGFILVGSPFVSMSGTTRGSFTHYPKFWGVDTRALPFNPAQQKELYREAADMFQGMSAPPTPPAVEGTP
jgi:hypothetical protein